MSRILSTLLGADEPMFSLGIERFERTSGRAGVDVQLTADIIAKSHQKTRELGLDPRDTTGPELYRSLMNLVSMHDRFLAQRIGVKDPTNVSDAVTHIKSVVDRMKIPKTAWVLKTSVAKRLLKATPPKKVMKHLGYRSIDSMLKRESVTELYAALRFVESPEWLNNFLKKYALLRPSDFEHRQVEIIKLGSKKWGDLSSGFLHKRRHNIVHLKELGVVAIAPLPITHLRGVTIALLPLVIHYMNEIRTYSAYFKMQQVRPDFGLIVARTLIHDPGDHAVVAAQQVHWRIIHRYFGGQQSSHPEFFEPHVMPEDLEWRKAEEVLYRLEPALHFWHGMDYVGMITKDGPISFNLMDMAISYVNDLPFASRSMSHLHLSLGNELLLRYLAQPTLEQHILRQLNTETVEPALLALSQRLNGRN